MNCPSHVTITGSNNSIVLPVLPKDIKNGVSGQMGQRLFVGLGTAGLGMFVLDLKTPEAGWYEIAPFPGPPRDGAACAVANFHGSRAVAATGEWFAHRGLDKVWNHEIYARKDSVWHVAGCLPKGLAYGASFEIPQGLLLVGGEDQQQTACTDVLLLTWDDLSGEVKCTTQRPVPKNAQTAGPTHLQGNMI